MIKPFMMVVNLFLRVTGNYHPKSLQKYIYRFLGGSEGPCLGEVPHHLKKRKRKKKVEHAVFFFHITQVIVLPKKKNLV